MSENNKSYDNSLFFIMNIKEKINDKDTSDGKVESLDDTEIKHDTPLTEASEIFYGNSKYQVFARVRYEDNKFCRDETILKLGGSEDSSWNLICNLVMLNPGSAKIYAEGSSPLRFTKILIDKDVGKYTEIDEKDNFYQFLPDPTMCVIAKMFEGQTGVVKIHNLFNIRYVPANASDAIEKINEVVKKDDGFKNEIFFTPPEKYNFCDKPVIFAYGGDLLKSEKKTEWIKRVKRIKDKIDENNCLRYFNKNHKSQECAIGKFNGVDEKVNHLSQMIWKEKWTIENECEPTMVKIQKNINTHECTEL